MILKKRRIVACLISLFAFSFNAKLHAAKTNWMLFWYPGGAGSTEEAAPYMQAFADYVNSKIAPYSIRAEYRNTEEGGWEFMNSKKPALAIIGYPLWVKIQSRLKSADAVMTCRPLPEGNPSEKYMLVMGSGKPEVMYSSFPMTKEFADELFPGKSIPESYKSTDRIVGILRKISGGEKAWAVLTPDEASSFRSMKSDWIKNLKYQESKPVSAALVVLFSNDEGFNNKIISAFLDAENDPAANDVLTELRLKGFANK